MCIRDSFRIIHQASDRTAQCIRVFGLDQQPCLLVRHRLDHATGRKPDDGYPGRSGLQCSHPEAFRQCRVCKQVETTHERIEIFAKTRKLHDFAKIQRCRLCPQLIVEIALAKHDEAQLRVTVFEVGNRLQQERVPLARNQLSRGRDNEVIFAEPKTRAHRCTVWRCRERVNVNGTTNDLESLVFHPAVAKYVGYGLGYQFYELLGRPIVDFYAAEATYNQLKELYETWDVWAVGIAGFTPVPYKVVTITAGAFKINFATFMLVSAISRAGRFFLVGGLIQWFGPTIKPFIVRYFNLLCVIFMILLLGGFLLLKYVF